MNDSQNRLMQAEARGNAFRASAMISALSGDPQYMKRTTSSSAHTASAMAAASCVRKSSKAVSDGGLAPCRTCQL
jgi:hypothetical protein